MQRVVSVSLGASSGNLKVEAGFLGERFSIEREGTDGDMRRAIARIAELDGQVAAIGLGGIDLYLIAGGRRYVIRDAARMAAAAKQTPVVDGSGLKHTLERETVRRLQETGQFVFRGKKVLLVSAVDRFGMAEALVETGAEVIFGDIIFGVGLPIPIRTLAGLRRLARTLLPVITQLPFQWFYPTGEKQESFVKRHPQFYGWADVVAGDFHYIRRYMPERMDGKALLTNTVRSRHLELLRERGVATLITTTPEFEGQWFGTNVMEGVLVALLGKRPEVVQPQEYLDLLARLQWQPRVQML